MLRWSKSTLPSRHTIRRYRSNLSTHRFAQRTTEASSPSNKAIACRSLLQLRNIHSRVESAKRNTGASILPNSADLAEQLRQLDSSLRKPNSLSAESLMKKMDLLLNTSDLQLPLCFAKSAADILISRGDAIRLELLLHMIRNNWQPSSNNNNNYSKNSSGSSPLDKLLSHCISSLFQSGRSDQAAVLWVRMSNSGGYHTSRSSLYALLERLSYASNRTPPSLQLLDSIRKSAAAQCWDQHEKFQLLLLRVLRQHIIRSCGLLHDLQDAFHRIQETINAVDNNYASVAMRADLLRCFVALLGKLKTLAAADDFSAAVLSRARCEFTAIAELSSPLHHHTSNSSNSSNSSISNNMGSNSHSLSSTSSSNNTSSSGLMPLTAVTDEVRQILFACNSSNNISNSNNNISNSNIEDVQKVDFTRVDMKTASQHKELTDSLRNLLSTNTKVEQQQQQLQQQHLQQQLQQQQQQQQQQQHSSLLSAEYVTRLAVAEYFTYLSGMGLLREAREQLTQFITTRIDTATAVTTVVSTSNNTNATTTAAAASPARQREVMNPAAIGNFFSAVEFEQRQLETRIQLQRGELRVIAALENGTFFHDIRLKTAASKQQQSSFSPRYNNNSSSSISDISSGNSSSGVESDRSWLASLMCQLMSASAAPMTTTTTTNSTNATTTTTNSTNATTTTTSNASYATMRSTLQHIAADFALLEEIVFQFQLKPGADLYCAVIDAVRCGIERSNSNSSSNNASRNSNNNNGSINNSKNNSSANNKNINSSNSNNSCWQDGLVAVNMLLDRLTDDNSAQHLQLHAALTQLLCARQPALQQPAATAVFHALQLLQQASAIHGAVKPQQLSAILAAAALCFETPQLRLLTDAVQAKFDAAAVFKSPQQQQQQQQLLAQLQQKKKKQLPATTTAAAAKVAAVDRIEALTSLLFAHARLRNGFRCLQLLRKLRAANNSNSNSISISISSSNSSGRGNVISLRAYQWTIMAIAQSTPAAVPAVDTNATNATNINSTTSSAAANTADSTAIAAASIAASDEWKVITHPAATASYIASAMLRDGHSIDARSLSLLLRLFTKAIQIAHRRRKGAVKPLIQQMLDFTAAHYQTSSNNNNKNKNNSSNNNNKDNISSNNSNNSSNTAVVRELIKALCVAGREEDAYQLLHSAPDKYAVAISAALYEPLLFSYAAVRGLGDVAKGLLVELTNSKLPLTDAVVVPLVLCYLQQQQPQDALDYVQDVFNQHAVRPSASAWLLLVDHSLARGDVFEARRVVALMDLMYTASERDTIVGPSLSTTTSTSTAATTTAVAGRVSLARHDVKLGTPFGRRCSGALSDSNLRERFAAAGYDLKPK